jgi:ATP-binding cassette, subfamily G (WHITE), member 2, PDR
MQPPAGRTCGAYLTPYASAAGGRIYNPDATANCQYCSASNADQFLESVAISYGTRWRDYGIGFAFIGFNIGMAVALYYVVRVRKGRGRGVGERVKSVLGLGLFRRGTGKENAGSEGKKASLVKGE